LRRPAIDRGRTPARPEKSRARRIIDFAPRKSVDSLDIQPVTPAPRHPPIIDKFWVKNVIFNADHPRLGRDA